MTGLSTFIFLFITVVVMYCMRECESMDRHLHYLCLLMCNYNKPYYRCIVRFKFNHGAKCLPNLGWRTVRFDFYREPLPRLADTLFCRIMWMSSVFRAKRGGGIQSCGHGWHWLWEHGSMGIWAFHLICALCTPEAAKHTSQHVLLHVKHP